MSKLITKFLVVTFCLSGLTFIILTIITKDLGMLNAAGIMMILMKQNLNDLK